MTRKQRTRKALSGSHWERSKEKYRRVITNLHPVDEMTRL